MYDSSQNNKVSSMTARDRYALAIGIFLGIASGVFTAFSALVAGAVFLFCAFLSPLIVSLVARNRIMILSLIPNLIMTVTAITLVLVTGYFDMQSYALWQILLGIMVIFMIGIISALAVSGLVKLILKKG